ncbi:MAG: hypothetical protein OEV55_09020 [candidate division Zixibacteria bacterium]|nr:hypothetical protein [candidate division Zixibacteria bacterium]
MKTSHKISILITLVLILLILNLKANNLPQSSYVPTVVITAPWGEKNFRMDKESSKPGEFGFYLDESGLEHGPTAFTVAPNGDIYIADNINKRVQRFSSSGSFIEVIPNAWGSLPAGLTVDQEGNIYSPNTYTGNPKVHKFDQNGNEIKVYPIIKDEEMGTDRPYNWSAFGISCDDSGRVFIQYSKRGGSSRSFQIGTKELEFSSAQQKATLKDANFGFTANVPNLNKFFSETNLLGVDRDAVYTMIKDEKNPTLSTINKITYDGRLIATYTVDWSQANCRLITAFSMNKHTVFDKGNVYSFCSDKEGIRIIKWSPSGK